MDQRIILERAAWAALLFGLIDQAAKLEAEERNGFLSMRRT